MHTDTAHVPHEDTERCHHEEFDYAATRYVRCTLPSGHLDGHDLPALQLPLWK